MEVLQHYSRTLVLSVLELGIQVDFSIQAIVWLLLLNLLKHTLLLLLHGQFNNLK